MQTLRLAIKKKHLLSMCSRPKLTEVACVWGRWWVVRSHKLTISFSSPGQTPTRTPPGSPQFAEFVESLEQLDCSPHDELHHSTNLFIAHPHILVRATSEW